MKLILADDDGNVLDSEDITREDWDRAQASVLAGQALLNSLHAGPAELVESYDPDDPNCTCGGSRDVHCPSHGDYQNEDEEAANDRPAG
jgi:hypothetical protein